MYVRIMSKCNNRNIGGVVGEVETCEKTRNVILKECPPPLLCTVVVVEQRLQRTPNKEQLRSKCVRDRRYSEAVRSFVYY